MPAKMSEYQRFVQGAKKLPLRQFQSRGIA